MQLEQLKEQLRHAHEQLTSTQDAYRHLEEQLTSTQDAYRHLEEQQPVAASTENLTGMTKKELKKKKKKGIWSWWQKKKCDSDGVSEEVEEAAGCSYSELSSTPSSSRRFTCFTRLLCHFR